MKFQFHFPLWLALSSHGNYKTSKVNVIQNWGLLLSSTCKTPWRLPSLIYKVDGMTYTLKSPRFSSRRHETTYGGKAMPHSVHVSCCWQLLRRHMGLSVSGSVSRYPYDMELRTIWYTPLGSQLENHKDIESFPQNTYFSLAEFLSLRL